jgi:hypothetical protein
MDIVEFVNSLNAKIAALEASNATMSTRVQELEEENASIARHSEESSASLRDQLEEEIAAHEFTRLQLEDEQKNVELGVKLLRELQTTSSDVGALQLAVQERDSTILRLQQELSAEREMRVQMEATALQAVQDKSNEASSRKALKSLVGVLSTQLRQQQDHCSKYEVIIHDQNIEIERKTKLQLDEIEISSLNDSPSENSAHNQATQAQNDHNPSELYLEELNSRFQTVLDLIEAAEGKPLLLDVSATIKSALRDSKQVIGEEIIIAHANQRLEQKLRQTTQMQLELEKQATTSLLAIISDLQSQAETLAESLHDPNTFTVSFVSPT